MEKRDDFSHWHDVAATEDLHHLIQRGRRLHDRAVFDALARGAHRGRQLFRKALSTFTAGDKVKCSDHPRASSLR